MKTKSILAVSALVIASTGCDSSTEGSEFGGGSGSGQTGGASGALGFGGNTGTGGGALLGDGAAQDDADLGDACGQTTVKGSSKEVDILLVIDKSKSMTAKPVGFTTDKWTALTTALPAALDPVKGGISFGLELFPNNLVMPLPEPCGAQCWDIPPGDTAVVVPIGPGTTTLPAIVAKLAIAPSGGTPTRAALQAGFDYLTTGAGKALAGDKYVLLATDGGPNGGTTPCQQATCTTNMDRNEFGVGFPNYCEAIPTVPDAPKSCLDDTATIAQLTTMAAAGIKTFVVGIPGSEPYVATLDALAVAGGAPASPTSPKYFAVTAAGGVEGLKQVFTTITQQLVKTCNIQLQSDPPDHNLLNVYVDGKVVPQAGADGWDLVSGDSGLPVVVLKGATCAAIEAMGANKVQILYGCKDTVIN